MSYQLPKQKEMDYIHDETHEQILLDRFADMDHFDLALNSGDAQLVREYMYGFRNSIRKVNERYTPEEENPYQTAARLISVNTVLFMACYRNGVHPLYLHSVSRRFDKAIAVCSTEQEMVLMEKMAEEYCRLIRDAKMEHYGEFSDQVIRILLSNLSAPPSLTELAAKMYVSTATMTRRFKKETGQTIPEFINRSRIRVAKLYMSEGNLTFGEIAQAVGFGDASYFSKVFRRLEGISPSEFCSRSAKNAAEVFDVSAP